MVTDQVSFKNHSGASVQNSAPASLTRVLIPVSFSDLSYNALAYALKLVKAFNGVIDLFHIIDLDDVVESDNPVVVKRWMMKREKESASRIQGLCEIIDESQVYVSSSTVVIGHKRSSMLRKIHELGPDLIVLGKSSKSDNLATYISENSSCAVLAVPFSPGTGIPSRIALAADQKPITESSLSSFFRIVQHTTQSFSLLRPQQEKSGGAKQSAREIYVNGHDLKINYINSESIVSYVAHNQVDLLCTIRRKKSFIRRFFLKHRATEIADHLDIPVLTVAEAPRRY
jgi:nucleotide-binding universal stress UspA family protein